MPILSHAHIHKLNKVECFFVGQIMIFPACLNWKINLKYIQEVFDVNFFPGNKFSTCSGEKRMP